MNRVAIIGCGGSGKSFLARELNRRTGLPTVHLDALYWDPEWRPRHDPAEWEALQRELVAAESWIIDGNYGATMDLRLEAADTVIFLDLPTHACLLNVLSRRARHPGRRPRPDVVGRERLGVAFLKWIAGYRRHRRPKVLARLGSLDSNRHVVVLTSRSEVNAFLDHLTRLDNSH